MISVSGQLIDKLRAMKDLVSSLLKNVSGLVMNCPENKWRTPSPSVGEGGGEGEHAMFTPTRTLPHQGGGQ
jgi:hypothetical protein